MTAKSNVFKNKSQEQNKVLDFFYFYYYFMSPKNAEVVKLADAHGSGPCGHRPCGFESHLRHNIF